MLSKTSFDLSLTDAENYSRMLKASQALVVIFDWFGETANTKYYLAIHQWNGITSAPTYQRILELDLAQARNIIGKGLAVWDHRGIKTGKSI